MTCGAAVRALVLVETNKPSLADVGQLSPTDQVYQTVHTIRSASTGRRELDRAEVERIECALAALRPDYESIDVVVPSDSPVTVAAAVLAMSGYATPSDRLWAASDGGRFEPMPFLPASPVSETSPRFADRLESRRLAWQAHVQPEALVLDLARREVIVGSTRITLPFAKFFWYAAVATSPVGALQFGVLQAALSADARGQIVVNQRTRFAAEATSMLAHLRRVYRLTRGKPDQFDSLVLNACTGPTPQLPATLAKVAKALRQVLGKDGARPYCAYAVRGEGVYMVAVPANCVASTEPNLLRSVSA